jgi:hypothetical protein
MTGHAAMTAAEMTDGKTEATIVVKSVALNVVSIAALTVALIDSAITKSPAIAVAVSGLLKYQEIPSLKSPTKRLRLSKPVPLLGRPAPRLLQAGLVCLPTSSPSEKWLLCSKPANKDHQPVWQ